jgi:hypothetical protein
MSMEHKWTDTDRRKPKHSEKNLFNCHFVHHKFHMEWPGKETASPRWQACDQHNVYMSVVYMNPSVQIPVRRRNTHRASYFPPPFEGVIHNNVEDAQPLHVIG